jgi:hypothetical protein
VAGEDVVGGGGQQQGGGVESEVYVGCGGRGVGGVGGGRGVGGVGGERMLACRLPDRRKRADCDDVDAA